MGLQAMLCSGVSYSGPHIGMLTKLKGFPLLVISRVQDHLQRQDRTEHEKDNETQKQRFHTIKF